MGFSHIVFDVDGTLLNSEYANLKSFQDLLLEERGRLYPPEELAFSLGITGEDALRRMGVAEADLKRLWDRWADLIRGYAHTLSVFPGIPETVTALDRRGCRMGVVTSRVRQEWEETLPLLPFADLFGQVVPADLTQRHKPFPDPLLKYMELTGAGAGEVLYVGDAPGDAACAHAAGAAFALACWGAADKTVPAEYYLTQPGELLAL